MPQDQAVEMTNTYPPGRPRLGEVWIMDDCPAMRFMGIGMNPSLERCFVFRYIGSDELFIVSKDDFYNKDLVRFKLA